MNKLYIIFKMSKIFLSEDFSMKSWKTTLSGLFAAAGQIFPIFGLPVELGQAVSVIGLFLIGLFAKDSNVTGGKVVQ